MRMRWAAAIVAGLLACTGTQAQAQMPDDLRVGYQAYRAGQFQEAATAFGRAIDDGRLDRDALAVTLNNRGVAYSQLGNFDAAIADYLRAQDLKPGDPTTVRNLRFAYVTRGLASANRGNRAAAKQDYDRALEVDPNYLEALQYRGALLVEMGANAEAAADFRRVLTLQPDNPAAIAALATLEGEPANAAPAPQVAAPADLAVPQAAEGAAPDSVQAAVARTQAAQERAQAALDDALSAARQVEPTAAPEEPATQPQVEPPAGSSDAPAPVAPAPAETADAAPPTAPAEPVPSPRITTPPAPAPEESQTAEPATPPVQTASRDEQPQDAPDAEAPRFRVTTSVNMRGGPGNSFGIIGSLEPGAIVTPDAEDKGWYRIPRTGERSGWVYRRFLAPAE
ncbi:MAG TPA: tetratricopeptide repeat protein [Geminicoccus sp.]|uniref:tetratricopeptide repeat protein n=1 Tax=Geminicoccus sp. TaxID=2024832 RepID=UPI002E32F06D|nr:tetratricopeptide repeat protein [Geminicoccus sp.]HEX2526415.1 tetratricopeptide repeat protein [Geminicoccus sp.]